MDSAAPPAPAGSLSPPAVGWRRAGGRGALDHSLVGPPSGAFAPQQVQRHSLDHSLAAPAGWLASQASSPAAPATGRGAGVPKDFAGSSGEGDDGTRAGEAMLDLLVVVVDETFALPRLSGAPSFHGRVHDVRGFSAQLSGDELVAQCVQGVPVVSTRDGRWCLCWSEVVSPDEHSDHELGAPGSRIEVIEEPAAGTTGGVARVLENWTLEEAGIETNDVLWCRYLVFST